MSRATTVMHGAEKTPGTSDLLGRVDAFRTDAFDLLDALTRRSTRTPGNPALPEAAAEMQDLVNILGGIERLLSHQPERAARPPLGPRSETRGPQLTLLARAVSLLVATRGRRLPDGRSTLVEDAGLLERALLPDVPERMGPLSTSAAYRPADGPGAGGDFYDVFQLDSGCVAAILGDVSGHGRAALERATLMHYTLRAYLEMGLSPYSVLELADQVRDGGSEGEFATAVIATYDAGHATLTYACAGHPQPIILGSAAHEPVTVCSSPPIGLGMTMAFRQSTIALPAGSTACLYTDGVVEARSEGSVLGRERLAELVQEGGSQATAAELLDRVAIEAGGTPDDMAACFMRPREGAFPTTLRTEELELMGQVVAPAERFLLACGVGGAEAQLVARSAQEAVRRAGTAVLRVSWTRTAVNTEILPADAEPPPSLSREPALAAQR